MYVVMAVSALVMTVGCAQFQKPRDPMLNNVMKMTPKDDPDVSIQHQATGEILEKPEVRYEPRF